MGPLSWQPRVYAALLGLIALALLLGGGNLALLGGSIYFLIAGMALVGVVLLLWQRRREALVL